MSANEKTGETEAHKRFSLEGVKHPFLEGLNPDQLRILASCAMPVEFAEGAYVFRQGDPANRFYCLTEGRVDLLASDGLMEQVAVQTIGAGGLLGWSWICPPYEWNFDARAIEPTKAVFFYATRLREECETNPALGYEIMKRISVVMMERLQSTRRVVVKLGRGTGV